MILLQGTIPDTSGYLILGYAVIFVSLFLHLASLVWRRRAALRDIQLLEELDKES